MFVNIDNLNILIFLTPKKFKKGRWFITFAVTCSKKNALTGRLIAGQREDYISDPMGGGIGNKKAICFLFIYQ